MRLFTAVDLDAPARAVAASLTRAVADWFEPGTTPSPARWVAPAQLHFTLRFLGDVTEPRVTALRQVLQPPWDTGAFTASFGTLDLFPVSGAPRVIWLGMDQGRDQIYGLKAELDGRLTSIGFKPEKKPFRAHLTLGRVRRPSDGVRGRLHQILAESMIPTVRWVVDRVTLYESRVSFRGATYHALESVPLPPLEAAPAHPPERQGDR